MVRPLCQVRGLHCGVEKAKRLKVLAVCTERGGSWCIHESWRGCSMYAAKKTLIQSLTATKCFRDTLSLSLRCFCWQGWECGGLAILPLL